MAVARPARLRRTPRDTLEFPIDPVTFPPAGGDATEAEPPPPPPRRGRRWPVAVAGLVAVVALGAGIVRLPYYVLSPGSATAVEPLIKVQGAQNYQHPGRILFTTVSLAGDVNAYALLHGWLSSTEDVVSRKAITGGTPTKQYNAENIQAMTDSKTAATKVALERLGYTVPARGDGAQIVQVVPQGAADGLLKVGDVITAVDGVAVHFDEQSVDAVHAHKPGDVITFTVTRDGASQTVAVKAGDDGNGVAKVGVALQTMNLRFDFPVQVSIDTGKVAGPSAGLAFTLALLDDLAPGDLTGGKKVAVTGTIDIAGKVGPVGGVAQKTAAARRAGAIAFLVPPDEERDARKHSGKMQIIVVKTLDDAVAALQRLGGAPLPAPSTTTTTGH